MLGAARDSRPAGVVKRMYGDSPGRDLHWANLGLQQVEAEWGNGQYLHSFHLLGKPSKKKTV